MKRLFCAVKVAPAGPLTEVMESFRQGLTGASVNWVNPHHLHITLRFLGDTPSKDIGPLIDALHLAAAGFPPFSFRVQGCGSFGPPRQPRVIWLGIHQAQQLIRLSQAVNHQLSRIGYPPEQKLFTPHLTIGRIKQIDALHSLNQLEADFGDSLFAEVDTKDFHLFESKLLAHGPVYKVIQTFELGEGHRA